LAATATPCLLSRVPLDRSLPGVTAVFGSKNEQAWYASKPLRFTCTRCGYCCRRPGEVLLGEAEAERIAERLCGPGHGPDALTDRLWRRAGSRTWRIVVHEGQACPLLGPDGCTVNDIKPIQCATYPFWSEIVATRWSWLSERRACEGIGHGEDLYDVVEVADLLAERARTRPGT